MLSKNKVTEKKTTYHVVKNGVNDLGGANSKMSTYPVIEADADKEMLDMLTKSLIEFRADIERAYQQKDFDTLIKTTHRTHGALCYTKTPQLKEAVKAMELALRKEELNQIDEIYNDVIKAIETFNEAYRLKLEGLKS